MPTNIPLSLKVFESINMDDSKSVALAIKSFGFDDLESQSNFFQSLKDDLGISIKELADILSIPDKTFQSYLYGTREIKPAQIRSITFLLYIRSTDNILFDELIRV